MDIPEPPEDPAECTKLPGYIPGPALTSAGIPIEVSTNIQPGKLIYYEGPLPLLVIPCINWDNVTTSLGATDCEQTRLR